MQEKSEELVQFKMRIKPWLLARLVKVARVHATTITSEIERRLEQSFHMITSVEFFDLMNKLQAAHKLERDKLELELSELKRKVRALAEEKA